MAVSCKLSKEDCAEIYHALGCAHAANLQMRIGFDGEELEKGEVSLRKIDALAIYNALIDKRERTLQGAYDTYPGEASQPGTIPFELAEHVGRILAEIGKRGENLSAVSQESIA